MLISEKRLRANRENAKKAGRKPGPASIEREKARQYIAERIGEYMPQLFNVLIKKSIEEEDISAIRELFDRGFGRPSQALEITAKDERPPLLTAEQLKMVHELEDKLSKE